MAAKTFLLRPLTLRITAGESIADSDFYPLFLTRESVKPDIAVAVTRGALPQPDGTEIFHNHRRRRVSAQGLNYDYTCFSDSATLTHIPYACAVREGDNISLTVNYNGPLWDTMLFEALNLPDLLLQKGAGLLHASLIRTGTCSLLFAGPKQQGKSTQAALWRQYRGAEILNGDRAAIRSENGRLIAASVPFCGSSRECLNAETAVNAVVFPEKAPINEALRLTPFAAFKRLLGCLSYTEYDSAMQERAVALAEAAANAAPCFVLRCTKDERAITELEDKLRIKN